MKVSRGKKFVKETGPNSRNYGLNNVGTGLAELSLLGQTMDRFCMAFPALMNRECYQPHLVKFRQTRGAACVSLG